MFSLVFYLMQTPLVGCEAVDDESQLAFRVELKDDVKILDTFGPMES